MLEAANNRDCSSLFSTAQSHASVSSSVVCSLADLFAMAQQCTQRRALLAGLPDRGEALKRQRANLDQFVSDNAAAFDAMIYEPWTRLPSEAGPSKHRFDVRASTVPGLRGVYLCDPLPACSREVLLLFYPGLLVTTEMYESFFEQYYCPTGLALPALRYTNTANEVVDIVIIGDPTSPGALVNDGCYGRSDGQSPDKLARSARSHPVSDGVRGAAPRPSPCARLEKHAGGRGQSGLLRIVLARNVHQFSLCSLL
jgi:hypothetical protein